MKVKELIEKLKKINPDLHVGASLDGKGVFDIGVPASTIWTRREASQIMFVKPNDPSGTEVVLLELDEA